ncbi:MAG: LPS export ABC transporter permease LptG [Gammaproteobacteria bacterium]
MPHMRIVDRYIGRNVIAATSTVLLVLLAIFAFFAFIDELEEIGRGSYTLGGAAVVVLLGLPGLAYELFPVAALIGALLGLGGMMERNEIAVVRAAGVSKLRVVWSVMKTGLVFVTAAVLVGELVFPTAEQKAREIRTLAISDRTASTTEHGFWARDGASYINIREILPGEEFRDIDILEFDDEQRLTTATRAAVARYRDGAWELNGIAQTHFGADGPVARQVERASWDSVLDPDLIGMIAINPETLSLAALSRYVRFARENGQNAQRWEHALWVKLGYPLATAVMVFLAIPLVLRGGGRSSTTGRRIMIGALIGLGFHVLNQTSGHLGVVFGVPAAASALGPTLALLVLGLALSYRTA